MHTLGLSEISISKKKLQVQDVKYVRTTFAYEFVYIEKKNNNFTGKSFAMLSPPVNSKRS